MSMHRSLARFVPPVVMSAVLIAGCGGAAATGDVVRYQADYPVYETSQEIVDAADLIVRGTVHGAEVTEMYPEVSVDGDPETNPQAGLTEEEASRVGPVVVTVVTIEVTDVLKGDVPVGAVLEVSQLGGELDGVRYEEVDTTLLSRGDDYLLLLADHGPQAPYDLLNPQQSAYVVTDVGALVPLGSELALDIATLDEVRAQAARE